MDVESTVPLWALVGVPAAALVLVTLVRWVPGRHRLVVSRHGRVARVHGPGLAWQLPWLETTDSHSEEPQQLPIGVRGTTRDGHRVLVLVDAEVQALPPQVGAAYVAPLVVAEPVIEEVAGSHLAAIDLDELPEGLVAQGQALRDEADRTTRPRGAVVSSVNIAEIDVILVPDADAGHGPG